MWLKMHILGPLLEQKLPNFLKKITATKIILLHKNLIFLPTYTKLAIDRESLPTNVPSVAKPFALQAVVSYYAVPIQLF